MTTQEELDWMIVDGANGLEILWFLIYNEPFFYNEMKSTWHKMPQRQNCQAPAVILQEALENHEP